MNKLSQKLNILRDTINGELNRMNVTDDKTEIDNLAVYLHENIMKYIEMEYERVQEYEKN